MRRAGRGTRPPRMPHGVDLAVAVLVAPTQAHKLTRNDGVPWQQGNAGVLLFFILVVQMGDVFQFLWNHTAGKRKIAPAINESRTWEGFTGGVLSAMVLVMKQKNGSARRY